MTTITRENAEIKSFITGFLSDPAHDNQSSDSLLANVFRIAQASLEAEPVAWTDEEELRDVRKYGFGEIFQCPPDKYADPRRVISLYREPPAVPAVLERLRAIVSDPRALPRRKEWVSGQQYSYVLLENVEAMVDEACRAAMLQDSQPVSQTYKLNELSGNYPVTPDGWISCSERMPKDGQHVIILCDGAFVLYAQYRDGEFFDVVRNGEEFFETQSRNVTHWMLLPEPPQEVN
ncbi:DUF551 domain-containing protein [Escherichia coli]|uniref:DUF551 domain-containing protein n=1 Tax=Escherichia coli TaxID=562 RepID=UPI0038B28CE5